MIFSSNNITELSEYSLRDRQQILALAADKLLTPEKLIINLTKLLVLIPPFIMLARWEGVMLFVPLLVFIIGYVVIMRPVSLYFQKKHLRQAIITFEKLNALDEQE